MRKGAFLPVCLVVLAVISSFAACSTTQSPNRQVSDSAITAQVKSKLASDVRLSSLTNIDVNTTNGVVTLAGQVENEQIKREVEEVARSVEGVVRVNNNLQVQPNESALHNKPTPMPR